MKPQQVILLLLITALVALTVVTSLLILSADYDGAHGVGGIPGERITETYGAEQFHLQLTAIQLATQIPEP